MQKSCHLSLNQLNTPTCLVHLKQKSHHEYLRDYFLYYPLIQLSKAISDISWSDEREKSSMTSFAKALINIF